MGTTNFSKFSALVNRRLLADPTGVSMTECVDEAEQKDLDVNGDPGRQMLEMAVETVIRLLFQDRCITPHAAGEIEQHALTLWESGWFAKQGNYECAEYRDFCNIKWTANSKSLPTIGFIDL